MARTNGGVPYDPKLRKTEHGSRLYAVWKRVRKQPHDEEWDYFPTFYEWAMQSDYTLGAWLRRLNVREPISKRNYCWYTPGEEDTQYLYDEKWVADWNRSVNRIRKHYGMPPLEGTDYGDL